MSEDRETLVAVLDALPRPAVIINADGYVLYANAAAEARFEADPGLVARIAERSVPELEATPISGTDHCLIQLAPTHILEAPLARAAERWALTRAEAEVLQVLSTGASYAAIALALSLTERTVEFHVSKILAKAGVDSSAALLVAVTRA